MSDYEHSDYEEVEEVNGENSDCEDIALGDMNAGTRPDYGPGDEVIFDEEELGRDADEDCIPPSVDTIPDFESLGGNSHTAQPRIPEGINLTSPLAFFNLFISEDYLNTFAT